MPHYCFHIRNGSLSSRDDEGGEFNGFALAEHEAEMNVGELIIESVKCEDPVTGWKIEVTDEDDRVLALIPAGRALH